MSNCSAQGICPDASCGLLPADLPAIVCWVVAAMKMVYLHSPYYLAGTMLIVRSWVQVAAASHRTMWLFEALLKQAAALSGLGDDFSDNEFAGLLGTLVAMADQEGLLQDAHAAHVLALVLQVPSVWFLHSAMPCHSLCLASLLIPKQCFFKSFLTGIAGGCWSAMPSRCFQQLNRVQAWSTAGPIFNPSPPPLPFFLQLVL